MDIGDIRQFSSQFAVPLEVFFTGAQRIRWYRDGEGNLHRRREDQRRVGRPGSSEG
jgi:hypothetical protein